MKIRPKVSTNSTTWFLNLDYNALYTTLPMKPFFSWAYNTTSCLCISRHWERIWFHSRLYMLLSS